MSILGNIVQKIFNHPQAQADAAAPTASATSTAPPAPSTGNGQATQTANVDVGAVLQAMAEAKGGGNYQTSIVDLLRLLDMDSSLDARKELANELNVHAGADGSAEENIALHKAVMQKLSENGGIVPDDWKH